LACLVLLAGSAGASPEAGNMMYGMQGMSSDVMISVQSCPRLLGSCSEPLKRPGCGQHTARYAGHEAMPEVRSAPGMLPLSRRPPDVCRRGNMPARHA
jgi:hypothetical protein